MCSEADRLVAIATATEAATTAAAATFTTTTASTAATVGATKATTATFATATTVAATAAFATTATVSAAATFTATTITTTAFAAAEAARARRTWLHGASFVHHQATTTQRCAVHAFDCCQSFGIAAHLDKTKTFRAARVTLHHDFSAGHSTELSK